MDENGKSANGHKHQNGTSNGYIHSNGDASASYVTAKNEPVDAYYSNGINNGFVKDIRLNGLVHRDKGMKDQWELHVI